MNIPVVWSMLPQESRDRVIDDIVAGRDLDAWQSAFDRAIAEAINFRTSSIRRLGPADFRKRLREALLRLNAATLGGILQFMYLHCRGELLCAVYDALGVVHEGTELADDKSTLEPQRFIDAVDTLGPSCDRHDLALCLAVIADSGLRGRRVGAAGGLGHLLDELARDEPEPDGTPDAAPASPDAFGDLAGFTTLDRLLIRAAVDSVNEVEGAFALDELDNLVQESIELNGNRHRTHFHRGFVDALTGRTLTSISRGENRDRRAWYVAGYLQGCMRHETDEQVLARVDGLADDEREVLLDPPASPGGIALAPLIIERLLRADRVEDAMPWVELYLQDAAPMILPHVLHWVRAAHLRLDAARISPVLELIDGLGPRLPDDALHRAALAEVRRHLAISWRRQGRMQPAQQKLDKLLERCPANERGHYLYNRGMVKMGIAKLEDLAVPNEKQRASFLAALERGREDLEGAAGDRRRHPAALYALALRPVTAPSSERNDAMLVEGAERLMRAINLMVADGRATWTRTGLLERARFYRCVLELRRLNLGTSVAAAKRIDELLGAGFDAPVWLLADVVNHAMMLDAPRTMNIARRVLNMHPRQAIKAIEIETAAMSSTAFLVAVEDKVDQLGDDYPVKERWDVLFRLLEAARKAPDRSDEVVSRLLDRLELLAGAYGNFARRLLAYLQGVEPEDLPWSEMEWREAQVRLAEQLDDLPLARVQLVEMTQRCISDRNEGALDLIEWLEKIGGAEETVTSLRERLAAVMPECVQGDADTDAAGRIDDRHVHVLFLGGNEKQAANERKLRDRIRRRFPNAQLKFDFCGWGSEWSRNVDTYERRIRNTQAVVMLRFMRTHFGRTVRRFCSQHEVPWIACTGHGFDSMHRAIVRAIHVSLEQTPAVRGAG